jgi:hypothetical protein
MVWEHWHEWGQKGEKGKCRGEIETVHRRMEGGNDCFTLFSGIDEGNGFWPFHNSTATIPWLQTFFDELCRNSCCVQLRLADQREQTNSDAFS